MTQQIKDLFGRDYTIEPGLDASNAYLKMAYQAILILGHPLHTLEILETAKRHNFWPEHLHGETPHKTLNARLSEHIREMGTDAIFFRTGPATYFLSDVAERYSDKQTYKVFHGIPRSKSIKQEDVLVMSKSKLEEQISGDFTAYDEQKFRRLFRLHCRFMDRSNAEDDTSVKQFVTFTMFHYNEHLLIHKRGTYSTASDRLKGAYSVGFGGHLNIDDFGLFSQGGEALLYNSSRELLEELYLDSDYSNVDEISDRSDILGYINIDDSLDAQHHIAVLVKFSHKSMSLPKKGELSINDLQWLDTTKPVNDLSRFDLWSRRILEGIYQGRMNLAPT